MCIVHSEGENLIGPIFYPVTIGATMHIDLPAGYSPSRENSYWKVRTSCGGTALGSRAFFPHSWLESGLSWKL